MKSLILILTLFSSQTVWAESAETHLAYVEAIQQNDQLRGVLEQLGYSVGQAAKKFADAEREALKRHLDLDLGTLAICGKARAGFLLGKGLAVCTTLFNAYSVDTTSVEIGGQMMAGLGAIYFRTGKRKEREYCFYGAGMSVGVTIYAEGGLMLEGPCPNREDPGRNRGFLVHLTYGVGVGADTSADYTKVKHLANYWGIF